jgi:hypothetical protein
MIYVIAALSVLLLFAVGVGCIRLMRTQGPGVSTLDELATCTRAVDMAALHNLVDSAETQYLQRSMPPAAFRIVQRERTLAAAEYVRNIAHNAALLIRLGQLAQSNPDPQLAQAAHAMVEKALHVRLVATFVIAKLYVSSFLPALPFSPEAVVRDYRGLTESAVLFTRLQRPAYAGRVSSVL